MIWRTRLGYGFAILVAIILGFGSRAYGDELWPFLSDHVGDALWASMVYFGFRALLPRSPLRHSLVLALLVSYVIEFSQLYQAEWINQIRGTLLGGLILGHGFLWEDLVRYAVGIALSFALDALYHLIKKNN
ncbi:MAG: DUF2809 domain-containing protein [Gorillibacterium sp.]|nr:DUF2809 domain-containing protein [Gorillibacterium sp.]